MNKNILLYALSLLALVVISCSDDSTGPSELTYESYQGYWEAEIENEYFSTIEFNKSNYVIEKYGGYTYGSLERIGDKLILEDFGTINIISENTDELVIEIETFNSLNGSKVEFAEAIKLSKINEKIADNLTTNLLCYDNWVVVEDESGLLENGSEFVFRRSGHYDFIRYDSGLNRNYWNYIDSKSFSFGGTSSADDGLAQIVELTRTKLIIRDQLYKYVFKR